MEQTHTNWTLTENGLYRNRHSGTNSQNAYWEWSEQKLTPTEHSLRMVCTETDTVEQTHWTLIENGLYRKSHLLNTHWEWSVQKQAQRNKHTCTERSLRRVCTETDTVQQTHILNAHWEWSVQKQTQWNTPTDTERSLRRVCTETVSAQQAHAHWMNTDSGLYRNRVQQTNAHLLNDHWQWSVKKQSQCSKHICSDVLNEHWQWSVQKQTQCNKHTPTERSLTMVWTETDSVQQAHMYWRAVIQWEWMGIYNPQNNLLSLMITFSGNNNKIHWKYTHCHRPKTESVSYMTAMQNRKNKHWSHFHPATTVIENAHTVTNWWWKQRCTCPTPVPLPPWYRSIYVSHPYPTPPMVKVHLCVPPLSQSPHGKGPFMCPTPIPLPPRKKVHLCVPPLSHSPQQ